MRSKLVQLFVALVGVATLASLYALPSEKFWPNPTASLVVIALAGFAGARPVRIPSLKTDLVATHPFVLCALAHFGPWAGVLTAVAGLSGTMVGARKRSLSIRAVFNVSAVILTAVISYWTFHALGGNVGADLFDLFLPLVGATTAYFIVNTGLVTAVIALDKRQSPIAVWKSNFQWTALAFFSGLTLAAGLLLVLQLIGVWGLALGIPPSFLFVSVYRSHKDRLEEKQRRIREVEALNAELERTVRDLQAALADVEMARSTLQREVNERLHAEAALRDSEEQLRQSQKMEAIGRLAGGVAHDFNNLLTVITGYIDLLLRKLGDESQRANATEVKKAAERATTLTRQLLAFSRRQVLTPKILDLNAVVDDMDKMLRRVIGEDIEFFVVAAPDLGRVKADPGQMEQVLMNLVVNARDAMAGGGRVTIDTANVERGAREAAGRSAETDYVCIKVSDTGCGMDARTRSHIFEPFFTTKPEGQGTGLGLSTVYGIVQQSDGWIAVESTPGEGTTFSIYLPRIDGAIEAETRCAPTSKLQSGTETVLLVEDEEQVRDLAREILEMNGYRVFESQNAHEALEICDRHDGPIHLMLTDVVMPQMNGRELYERLAPVRPEMKVIFMSGYTDRAMIDGGRIAAGVDYLPKPFTLDALAAKVRNVLDRRSG